MKSTSISLGSYFDRFVRSQVATGRYKNVSEVVEAALQLLENEERKKVALEKAIEEGLKSPRVEDFDFAENLKDLKTKRQQDG